MGLVFTNFNSESLTITDVLVTLSEFHASMSQQPSMDLIGRMENMINEMFDEEAWNASDDVISEDEKQSDVETLSFNERIAFKTYQETK